MVLELPIPAQEAKRHADLPVTRRHRERWLAELASTNRREHPMHLLALLQALNRAPLSPGRRSATLEAVRPALRATLDGLAGRLRYRSLPLPESVRTVLHRTLELLEEYALAYEILLASEGARLRRGQIALAAERALALHGERLLRCAQVYAEAPAGFWQRVNAVFDRAEQAGVANRPVADPEAVTAGGAQQSPRVIYQRILLFSLVSVEGLRRGEAARVYRALGEWSRDVELSTGPHRGAGLRDFAVDLEQAAGPAPCAGRQVTAESRLRVLTLDKLVDRVDELIRTAVPNDSPVDDAQQIAPDTLGRLIQHWRPQTHERHERAYSGEQVDAEVTLAVIHARLRTAAAEPAESARAHRRVESAGAALTLQTIAITPRDPSSAPADSPEATIARRAPGKSAGFEAARQAEASQDYEGTCATEPRWLLQDTSHSGYRIRWAGNGSSQAAVGELVALGLVGADGEQLWSLGVIRRMQFIDQHSFDIGVYALGRNPVAARVAPEPANPNRKRERSEAKSVAALILPGPDGTQTLIVPGYMFRTGDLLELTLPGERVRVRLAAIREGTGAFSQYDLAPPPERGRRAGAGN